MKVPVFRALDRSNKLLGIKGSYLVYALLGVAVALVLGLIIGAVLDSGLLGIVSFLGLSALMYVYLISFQSKHDEKERDQMIDSLFLPDNITVKPIKIYRYFKTSFKYKK